MGLTIYEKAMLDTIAYAEGTLGVSYNGYDVLFGNHKIIGWSTDTEIKHRCVVKPGPCEDTSWKKPFGDDFTTAAGRYQFVGSTWASSTKKMGLGFNAPMTAKNQDKAAVYLLKYRKVTDSDLENGVNSLSEFQKIINKIKLEWASFKLNKTSSKHTPKDYYDIYRYSVNKYKNGGATTVKGNTKNVGTMILDKKGKPTTIGSAGNTNRFMVNSPKDSSSTKIIYFWGGLESVIPIKKQYDQIPQHIKDTYYIVMAAGVTGSKQNPLSELKYVAGTVIKKSIKKRVLMGYSAGGVAIFNNYSSENWDVIAFIDPSVNSGNITNTAFDDRSYMVYDNTNWGGYPSIASSLITLNTTINTDGGVSIFKDIQHSKMVKEWFTLFGDKL